MTFGSLPSKISRSPNIKKIGLTQSFSPLSLRNKQYSLLHEGLLLEKDDLILTPKAEGSNNSFVQFLFITSVMLNQNITLSYW